MSNLRLQGESSISDAVGPETNGVSTGSRPLLELCMGRRQARRHRLWDRDRMAGKRLDLEAALAIRAHL